MSKKQLDLKIFSKFSPLQNIYVIGVSFPVVPKGEARIRVQISAAHSKDHLKKAISTFVKVGKQYQII